MNPNHLRYLHHGEWLEMGNPLRHEIVLAAHNLLRDRQDRFLPLVQALDQKLPGANLLPNVVPNLRSVLTLGHQVLVGVADPQVGNLLVVGCDDEIIAIPLHKNLGNHKLVIVGHERATRARLKPGNVLKGILNLVDFRPGSPGDFRYPPPAEGIHEIPYDLVFQSVRLFVPIHLDHQTLAQIPRANPGRIKGLDHLQHLQNLLLRNARRCGQLLDAGLHIAIVIHVADQHLSDLLIRIA